MEPGRSGSRQGHKSCKLSADGKHVTVCLTAVNPFITCNVCKKYLREAHTLKECLHTFCKKCLENAMQSTRRCPQPGCTTQVTVLETAALPDAMKQGVVDQIQFILQPSTERNRITLQPKPVPGSGMPDITRIYIRTVPFNTMAKIREHLHIAFVKKLPAADTEGKQLAICVGNHELTPMEMQMTVREIINKYSSPHAIQMEILYKAVPINRRK